MINARQFSSTRIHSAWIPSALFVAGATAYGGNLTIITNSATYRVLQDGYIRRVTVLTHSTNGAGTMKAKIFRYNGATYDFIAESEILIIAAGASLQTFELTYPIPCQPGDVLGVWMSTNVRFCATDGLGGIRYAVGDITTQDAFASTLTKCMWVDGLTIPPFLEVSGDSIMSGAGNNG